MTNHSEPAGNLGDGDIDGCDENGGLDEQDGSGGEGGQGVRGAQSGPGVLGGKSGGGRFGEAGGSSRGDGPARREAGFGDDASGRSGHGRERGGHGESRDGHGASQDGTSSADLVHGPPGTPYPEHQVTLRTPAELADALPYLLGYRPEDSIVLVALHDRDGRGRFGGRARLGIPGNADDWPSVAEQLTHGLVKGSERRGALPESMVAFLCQDPREGESGRAVMERLRPLAQLLRTACGVLDVPVIEALCISDGRFWSYCCPSEHCCPPDGTSMGLPGTSVLAAAATYAGLQVRGTLRELRARLTPWETKAAGAQESALDAVSMALIPRILDDESRAVVAVQTLELAHRAMRRFADATPAAGKPGSLAADLRDDELLRHDEAATLILGLQDRTTRDRAAAWMEGDEAGPALRLWRALARRCVGPYGEHAAAPLTLAGWVAWSSGDELEAREALAMALGADSEYLFARLLHQACNEGLDPESIRRCLRGERADRVEDKAAASSLPPGASDGTSGHARTRPSRVPARRRRRSRTTESATDRPGSRPSGTGHTRPSRSAPAGAPGTDGPAAGSDGTNGAARSRRVAGRPGTKKGDV
ncbi:DUF4192 domain-containing protein [Streptomyces sp. Qhu-G9]|uniref:DUF4192 domain-containing protein n=1 Tax=Streptomyces sp. Qhu-G9 TaxID=3452799 RepID=UPI0022ABCF7F|nr:DUF4192 domain-containing protein [Streptomyces aurantiacus]WAU84463.1 DUF4192 domain-containing protein [Streptomyces aurantiacus]